MVTMRVTGVFFDTAAVVRSMDPVKRDALSRAGATVRKRAQYSIRRRKGTSAPGQPPHKHGQPSLLTKFLVYAWDPMTATVVVGPLPLHGRGYRNVLEALEHGGTFRRHRGLRRSRRSYTARYRARPFMGPAKEEVEPQMAGFWAAAAAKQRTGRG